MVAMLPSPENGLCGRLKALHQLVEDSELGPLVLFTHMCLLIHIAVQCFDPKVRLCECASLRTLRRTRKWVWGFRMRGRKCLRVLTNSLHGMAAAAINLKASRRRGCNLRCGLVLVLPWQVLVSSSVGVPRASTLADNNIRDRRHFQDYFRRVQARTDEACTDYVPTYDAQRIVTMRSPFRDTARVE